ncbi:alpha/beta hydrolase [Moheibacter lacus]|uniref:Alpha/beta fold hydrolase n=1 Tax=Moheibacter lacus TaxID=2745851 RepID=A0A838ZU91_9FLAO|nr:alpha/beta fold hydrolase [Moheibacter lacus]MBA5630489.1 alpha/beta fold hydrolase [Moheibacter lacus]
MIHFKAKNPKGVVYYLHGNSGNLSGWGDIADTYLALGYNVLILDYRGFGKSEGEIESEKQFYDDVALGYGFLKERFNEDEIIVIGYSVETSAASHLASTNSPKLLILQAPYYNLTEIADTRFPFVPKFMLKYKFENQKHIEKTKCPVYIFHGDDDQTIFYEDAVKLKDHLKDKDRYITLNGQGHVGMNENIEFKEKLRELLN